MTPRFVIQDHHARTHHFDFRLERDGVLKSWAVPKGVPEVPGEKHLAIEVADHPIDYGAFEGTIPPGEYGAGTVRIWDSGTYNLHDWTPDKITFSLHGNRVAGNYNLIRFNRAGEHSWLLVKGND